MVRDGKPMLSIEANQLDLSLRFGHIPAHVKGDVKPWHLALVVWWRFVRQREVLALARACGREAEPD